jgi:hypothetical protein
MSGENTTASTVFTAAQLAAALGISKQAVQKALKGIRAGAILDARHTQAWPLDCLPELMRARLAAQAGRLGYRDAAALLAHAPARWEPSLPLAACDDHCLDQARQLQLAQGHALAVRNQPGVHLDDLLLRGYQSAFGHAVTARHARALFDRTLWRDGGREEFGRLELYLPARLKRRTETPATPAAAPEEFALLTDALQSFALPGRPTEPELACLWDRSFLLLRDARYDRACKRRLLKFLFRHAPFLAASPNALRVNFDRKLARWQAAGDNPNGLRDARRNKADQRATLPKADRDVIIGHAVFRTRGRVAQAVRELKEHGLLSEATARRLNPTAARKSYLPQTIRREVAAEVNTLLQLSRKGGRDAVTPPLDLNYEGIRSMDALQSDDFTPNFYVYVPNGQGWYRLTRCQFLPVIDFRSLRVLHFALHPEGQYNSAIIRTLFTRTFAAWGLPKVLYLERGLWKRSRLIVGDRRAQRPGDATLPISDADCETGLRGFGIAFKHAIRARSKPVERCGGLWWDLLDGVPGFCGREERKDRPEWLDRQMQEVEARKVHPSKYFFNLDQSEACFHEMITRYNATPQQGKRLQGLSPDEAFEQHWPHDDPPIKLPPECRYLLAHHRKPVEVKPAGIAFTINGRTYRFFGPETSERIGQKLVAWFNPEIPDICTFTTLDRQEPFTMPLHQSPNALATDELFTEETARAAGHAQHTRTRYRELKARFQPVFRGNLVAGETVELGAEIEQQRGEITAARQEQDTKLRKAQRLARKLGRPMSTLTHDLDRAIAGMEMQLEAQQEMEADR